MKLCLFDILVMELNDRKKDDEQIIFPGKSRKKNGIFDSFSGRNKF